MISLEEIVMKILKHEFVPDILYWGYKLHYVSCKGFEAYFPNEDECKTIYTLDELIGKNSPSFMFRKCEGNNE